MTVKGASHSGPQGDSNSDLDLTMTVRLLNTDWSLQSDSTRKYQTDAKGGC